MPFRKWNDISYALLNLPEPPFVIAYSTGKNQHMAWRSPVNYSKELFYVRLGLRDVKIRYKYLKRAILACQNVAKSMGKKEGPKTLANPFATISPDLKDSQHADLTQTLRKLQTPEFQALLEDPTFQDDLQHTLGLTLGESWALRFLLTQNAGQETPEQNKTASTTK